jgi:hypothetical protein
MGNESLPHIAQDLSRRVIIQALVDQRLGATKLAVNAVPIACLERDGVNP